MFRQTVALLTVTAFLFSPLRGVSAERIEHLVTATELKLRLAAAEQQRQDDIRTLNGLLQREASQSYLEQAGIEPQLIRLGIPQLDGKTLANLAQQSRELDADVTAGGYPGGRYFGLYLLLGFLVLYVLWTWVIADGYGTRN